METNLQRLCTAHEATADVVRRVTDDEIHEIVRWAREAIRNKCNAAKRELFLHVHDFGYDPEFERHAACFKLITEAVETGDLRTARRASTQLVDQRPEVQSRIAQSVCQSCPVRHDCFIAAIDTKNGFGVRGGIPSQVRSYVHRVMRHAVNLGYPKAERLYDTGATWNEIQEKTGFTQEEFLQLRKRRSELKDLGETA